MTIGLTVLLQVGIMFLIIVVGAVCYKTHLVTDAAGSELSNLLLYVVNPAIMLSAFQKPFEPRLAKGLLVAFGLAAISHAVAIAVSYLAIRKKQPQYKVERYAVIYSNCGFMAIPLINAVLGQDGVFYASAYIVVFNLLTWTQGVFMMTGRRDLKSLATLLTSPTIISIVAGLILFFAGIQLPAILGQPVELIANLNTPLAMIAIGISIAQTDLLKTLRTPRLYLVSALRLLAVPAMMLVVLRLLPADGTIELTNLIATACPVGASCLLFATRFGQDSRYASQVTAVSTLFSLLTIPLIVLLAGL